MTTSHPLVTQLRFARASFVICLEGVNSYDARKRINDMNCLSWTIGHLANQEHHYWIQAAQGKSLLPHLNDLVGYGKPASTPDLAEMWSAWRLVTAEADNFLETVTTELLEGYYSERGVQSSETIGTKLLRNIYHYWYHIGEARTVRELLGHTGLPEYVGDMSLATYRSEEP
jgi:hypothetical protein